MKLSLKRLGFLGMTVALALCGSIANAAVNISVGVSGEVAPGVYGRVNVNNDRYPTVILDEPVVVSRPVRYVEPIYLHVPPGQVKRWGHYCGRYNACGVPVYFVRSRDYRGFNTRYIPSSYIIHEQRYARPHYERHEERRDERHDRREERREDYRGNDRHEEHHDHGRGHGHGHDD